MTRFGAMLRALTIVAVATGMSTAALAQQKTAKQCRDEWKANEADFKAKKVKEKDYVAQCQAGTAAAPTAAPTATPTAATSGQKTAKQCRDEWKANEADFKAKKITQKAYVTECQAGTAPTPTTTAAPPATPPATPAATSGVKTAKQCRDEWRANEADFKARKIREKDYVTQCQAGTAPAPTTTAAPTTPPAPTPTTTAAPATPPPAPAPTTTKTMTPMTAPTTGPKPAPNATATPMGPNQFAAEAQAKGHCPSDLVVWVNTKSDVYHYSGHKDYGTTKQGAYMCEKDALAAHNRAAKNEKHP